MGVVFSHARPEAVAGTFVTVLAQIDLGLILGGNRMTQEGSEIRCLPAASHHTPAAPPGDSQQHLQDPKGPQNKAKAVQAPQYQHQHQQEYTDAEWILAMPWQTEWDVLQVSCHVSTNRHRGYLMHCCCASLDA